MIEQKDVIKLKVPYPDVFSGLAVRAHMYICKENLQFVKCQRLKPYMIGNPIFVNYIDEYPDNTRNPFRSITRIDCDKLFGFSNVVFMDEIKANRNVCDELFNSILNKLLNPEYINIAGTELSTLNAMVSNCESF